MKVKLTRKFLLGKSVHSPLIRVVYRSDCVNIYKHGEFVKNAELLLSMSVDSAMALGQILYDNSHLPRILSEIEETNEL